MNASTGTVGQPLGEPGGALISGMAPTIFKGWEPTSWVAYEQAALQFPSKEGLNALIDALWREPLLQGMPRVYVGENTVIVPASVVEDLRRKGQQFIVQKVLAAGDLSTEEVNQIRSAEESC